MFDPSAAQKAKSAKAAARKQEDALKQLSMTLVPVHLTGIN